MNLIRDAFHIGVTDLRHFFRSRMALVSFIVMPVFMMLMMGYIFPSDNSIKGLKIGIVFEDNGIFANMIKSQFEKYSEKYGSFVELSSRQKGIDEIKEGKLVGFFIIPKGFSGDILAGHKTTMILVPDQTNPQLDMAVEQMGSEMVRKMSARIGKENLIRFAKVKGDAFKFLDPISFRTEGIVKGKTSYFDFMAPGVMAMVAVMSVMNGLGVAIARDKEMGTLDGLLVSPISRGSIVIGKIFAQTIRGILQASIILLLAILLFGVTVHGSILLTFFLLILGIFSFIGGGIILTAMAPDQETGMLLMTTVTFPMLFLSGVFFPIQQMPGFMQVISKFFPLTYAASALRKVMILGASIQQVMPEIGMLLLFAVITMGAALPLFGKLVTD